MDYKLHTLKGDLFGGLTAAARGLARVAGFWRGLGLGCASGPLFGDRHGILRSGFRGNANAGFRSHRTP